MENEPAEQREGRLNWKTMSWAAWNIKQPDWTQKSSLQRHCLADKVELPGWNTW